MAYLLYDRNYLLSEGVFEGVFFPFNEEPQNYVSCYVKKPKGGGRKGQISTGHDLNLQYPPGPRPFDNSRTYQTYGPTAGLSLGFPAIVRIESIAIDVVQREELARVYLNISDGALVELYRSKLEKPLGTLCGTIRVPDYKEREMASLTLKFKEVEIKTTPKKTPKKKKTEDTDNTKPVSDPRNPHE